MRRVLVLLCLSGCTPGPAPSDAGVDAGAPFDAGVPDAGAVVDAGTPCATPDAGTLTWDGGVAVLALTGRVLSGLLDPSGCFPTDGVAFWVQVDRPAVLDLVVTPVGFSPRMSVHRGCSLGALGCGNATLSQVPLSPGPHVVAVSTVALGSGPNANDFTLSLTFTSDGG